MSHVTPELWKKFCVHVRKVEDDYWVKDGLIEDTVDEMVITINDNDDNDDDYDDQDHDDIEQDEQDLHLERKALEVDYTITDDDREFLHELQFNSELMVSIAP